MLYEHIWLGKLAYYLNEKKKIESSVIELMAPIILNYCAERQTRLGVS
jgi:hypothetical protein